MICWRAMRILWFAGLLACSLASAGQTPLAPLPTDPESMMRAAATSYNLEAPDSKPWHMRVTYQLYDANEQPAESGSLEYWWVSPERNRQTLTRGSAVSSRWQTAGGKYLWVSRGRFNFAETGLRDQFLSAIPAPDTFAKTTFLKEEVKFGTTQAPCAMLVPKGLRMDVGPVEPGLFPTYCFDPTAPVLVARLAWGAPTIGYGRFVLFHGHPLAGSVTEYESGKKILSAKLEGMNDISVDDPALTPAPDATDRPWDESVGVASGVMAGKRLGGSNPVYPQQAKENRTSGTVVLRALIGTDGRIHNLHLVSAPALSLAVAAIQAVQAWTYQPYLLNGNPVEVDTQVNVVFSLG